MSRSHVRSGTIRSYARHENGRSLIIQAEHTTLALTILTPGIVRVRVAPDGTFAPRRSWAVAPPDDDFAGVPFDLHETPERLTLSTTLLNVHIERSTCLISFTDQAGQVFCADQRGIELGVPDTPTLFVQSGSTSAPERRVACTKRIEPGEHFFGAGERAGQLEKRGRQLINWTTDPAIDQGHSINTDPLYIAIPVLMAVRAGLAYGLFFNNSWRSRFSLGWDEPDTWLMEADDGELDYYVVLGPTPAEVSEGLARLLGTLPLPPRWALGYHQSRWGYDTEAIVLDLAANFRQRQIPCDVIHLDIDYMDGYRVFTWNRERFPDPARLIADLRAAGFRVVAIIDPGVKVDPDYVVYRDGLEHDMFIRQASGEVFQGYVWPGAAVFPDFTRPNVRQWWGDAEKILVDQGISGIWNDMNEPTSFDRPFSEGIGVVGTLPLDAVQGSPDEQTVHAEVHNLYGSGMSQATYEGLRRNLGGERPFVLTRSAFAGIQRWSACWMGDNSSIWEHLEMTLPQLMNMGLSGVPFVGTDIGGFFGHAQRELVARWIQVGLLAPFCRGHSCMGTTPQEPWVFGPEVEQIYRTYMGLRYRLMPYLYSVFWEASQRGLPVLRPLFYHFPNDQATFHLHDQALLGPTLLAAPIYQPGRTHRAVYLPGDTWFDWWTNEPIAGPRHILAHAPLDHLPLYVRGGAIIPTGPAICYTDEQPLETLTLNVYPGNGSFTLYEDDGHTFAYEQGSFCTTDYTLRLDEARQLTLTIDARTGAYQPVPRQVRIRLCGVDERSSQGYPTATYAAEERSLYLTLDDDGTPKHFIFQV